MRKIFLELFSKNKILQIFENPNFEKINSNLVNSEIAEIVRKFWDEKKIDEKIDKMKNPKNKFSAVKNWAEKFLVRTENAISTKFSKI